MTMHIHICGRQTSRGEAAKDNASGYAPCILVRGHRDDCESGTAHPPPKAA
jgi:hypothetical protein